MTEQKQEFNIVKRKLIGYRKMANLTQGQVSDMLDVNRSTYNKKENKKDIIRKEIRTLRKFWVLGLESLSLKELKKELKLRTKIRDGKILLW